MKKLNEDEIHVLRMKVTRMTGLSMLLTVLICFAVSLICNDHNAVQLFIPLFYSLLIISLYITESLVPTAMVFVLFIACIGFGVTAIFKRWACIPLVAFTAMNLVFRLVALSWLDNVGLSLLVAAWELAIIVLLSYSFHKEKQNRQYV